MLTRSFRVTDKFTNALLKLAIYATHEILAGAGGLKRALMTLVSAFTLTLLTIIRGGTERVNRVTQRGQSIATQRQQAMAERRLVTQERALAQGRVIEDPLMARNRSLSALVVILLVVLIAFLVFSPQTDSGGNFGGGAGIIPQAAIDNDDSAPIIPSPIVEATEARSLLSEVSGTLVFTLRQNGQEDIWALPVGSNQPVRLTDSPQDDRDPAWSPDGGQIAFASRRDGPWNLYIMDLVAGEMRQLTFTPEYVGKPAWSPDGQFLVYEAYNREGGNIDLYIISADGQQGPFQFTSSPYPDLEPSWGPNGTDIAYIGWRNNSPEVLILSTQGQPEIEAINLSNSPDARESAPRWSPDGTQIAYTAEVDGVRGIYVKNVADSRQVPRLIGRGEFPSWNPLDDTTLVYSVRQGNNAAVYLGQVDTFGVGASAIAFEGRISNLDWTASLHSLSGFNPNTPPLYQEVVERQSDGRVQTYALSNLNAPEPLLSDAVNDSFEAMRGRVVERVGYDLLGTLESVFWRRERRPEPGEDLRNWHYTGRAISINRDLVLSGNPPPLAILREDAEIGVRWRVMLRVAEEAQDGALGEPLRALPWDFAARFGNDPEAFSAGGRYMTQIPAGYYVDLNQIMADFGWEGVYAARNWRSNYSGVLFWQFQKTDGLTWDEAMLEIYTAQELEAFLLGLVPQAPTTIPELTVSEQEPTAPPTAIPVDAFTRTPLPLTDGLPTPIPTPNQP